MKKTFKFFIVIHDNLFDVNVPQFTLTRILPDNYFNVDLNI